ncbi:MAG: Maf family protein [Alphaproteobacteria bacterium]|nr:Maf family protein [Alphaproteobacteria bacterium]
MTFILASGSASRQRLLHAVGVPFAAIPADMDEAAIRDRMLGQGAALPAIASALADAKALHVSQRHPDALVLGADQILIFENELISKCAYMAEARALLIRLRGKTHSLVSGLSLARAGTIVWRHASTPKLTVRAFSDTFLDSYLAAEGEGVLSGVGCYKLEGLGAQLFERVEGDYFSVLGLPLLPLLAELRNQGVIRA